MARLELEVPNFIPTRLLIEQSGLVSNEAAAKMVNTQIFPRQYRYLEEVSHALYNPDSKQNHYFGERVREAASLYRLEMLDDFDAISGEVEPPSAHVITLDVFQSTFIRSLLKKVDRDLNYLSVQRMIMLAGVEGGMGRQELERLTKVTTFYDHAMSSMMLLSMANYAEDPDMMVSVLKQGMSSMPDSMQVDLSWAERTQILTEAPTLFAPVAGESLIGTLAKVLLASPIARGQCSTANGLVCPLEAPFIDAVAFTEDAYDQLYPLVVKHLS